MDLVLILIGISLLGLQCLGLYLLVRLGGERTNFHVYQFYNPLCWFSLFYILWFLIPQPLALMSDHFIIGLDAESSSFRLRTALTTQFYLLTFLAAVYAGARLTAPMWPSCIEARPLRFRRRQMKSTDQLYVFSCFLFGIVATAILGLTLMSQQGMRSELVKSDQGLILTAIAFFGNFAFAVIVARAVVQKNYLVAAIVFLMFGGAVFFTGSRGRLMFPLLLAIVYVFSYQNAFNYRLVSTIFIVSVSILLFSDVFLLAMRGQQDLRSVDMGELFTKRNFDGFANFALISSYDEIPRTPSVLFTGARSTFMEHYFPSLWKKGVGTGTTFPGMSWIAGGWMGMLSISVIYGAILGGINIVLRRLKDERLYWAYLFCMVWFCAIGGNLQESLDKMCVAAFPALLWWFIDAYVKRRSAAGGQEDEASPQRRSRRSSRRPERGATSGGL